MNEGSENDKFQTSSNHRNMNETKTLQFGNEKQTGICGDEATIKLTDDEYMEKILLDSYKDIQHNENYRVLPRRCICSIHNDLDFTAVLEDATTTAEKWGETNDHTMSDFFMFQQSPCANGSRSISILNQVTFMEEDESLFDDDDVDHPFVIDQPTDFDGESL
jgi:hypothetical protein